MISNSKELNQIPYINFVTTHAKYTKPENSERLDLKREISRKGYNKIMIRTEIFPESLQVENDSTGIS